MFPMDVRAFECAAKERLGHDEPFLALFVVRNLETTEHVSRHAALAQVSNGNHTVVLDCPT